MISHCVYHSVHNPHCQRCADAPVETPTSFTAAQWKSRALYEQDAKLAAIRALRRARDDLNEALFAMAQT